jgi:hypothetical protein
MIYPKIIRLIIFVVILAVVPRSAVRRKLAFRTLSQQKLKLKHDRTVAHLGRETLSGEAYIALVRKAEVHDVAVLDHVVLALQPHFARVLGSGFA